MSEILAFIGAGLLAAAVIVGLVNLRRESSTTVAILVLGLGYGGLAFFVAGAFVGAG